MNYQYSFKNNNNKGKLFIVATPIGNFDEISLRAINVLKNVDTIYCEDTRNTNKLLNKFNIKNNLYSFYQHNENFRNIEIIKKMNANKDIAIVSDAGYPLISDPGNKLVKEAIKNNFFVIPINGSNACLSALVSSGLRTDIFTFVGFLKEKSFVKKQKELEKFINYEGTIVFYESPNRILETLKCILKVFGNIDICVAKEMTKIHEQFYRGTIKDVLKALEKINKISGEFVLIIENNIENIININNLNIEKEILFLKNKYKSLSKKDICLIISYKLNIPKNKIYNICNRIKGDLFNE